MNNVQLKIHLTITAITVIFWVMLIAQIVPVWVPLIGNLVQLSYVISCVGRDLWRDIINLFTKN